MRPVGSTSSFHIGPWRCRGRRRGLWRPFPGALTNKSLFLFQKIRVACWLDVHYKAEATWSRWSPVRLGTLHMTLTVQSPSHTRAVCTIFQWRVFATSPVHRRCRGMRRGRPWSTAMFGNAGSIPLLVPPSRVDYYFSLDKRRWQIF